MAPNIGDELEGIHYRLGRLRDTLGLSLRAMAETIHRETGYEVSHDSVRHYEDGRTVPARYLRAVAATFGLRPEWLLSGVGPAASGAIPFADEARRELDSVREVAADPEGVRAAWERFVAGGDGAPPGVREVILESWRRSAREGVDPGVRGRAPRLSADETETVRRRSRRLVEAADVHLRWLSTLLSDLDHVAYLTDHRGIVLDSVARPTELQERWSLFPGCDWSERVMGTNGAGTALETGRPVAVLGSEHFAAPFHDAACMAAPITGPDGRVVGALDLSTALADAHPQRLYTVVYAAGMISRDLGAGEG